MAVARINHDLRNILSAAQLISDRLATIPDPLAQRLAPRLVATLDRAIQFCQSTLTYGASRELPPSRRRFDLSELVSQVVEAGKAEHDVAIDYNIDIPPRFCVYADPDHILRVLENLSRNAAQALMAKGAYRGTSESHSLCGHSHRWAGADRDQRHRSRISGRSKRADFRAFPQVDERGRRRPRARDRGGPGDAKRRGDHARARPRRTTSIAARGS